MSFPRILTIQDISGVGQCSLTVALPIISACGVETCVLPSAVLSTHTGGFTGYTFRDLTEDMPGICAHWKKEGIMFDGIYTGYLGSARQIDYVKDIIANVKKKGAPVIVDPAMADRGMLYAGFDGGFVEAMKELCKVADYILPNITEACFLSGVEYKTEYDREYIDLVLKKLNELGCENIVLTGVSYAEDKSGVVISEAGSYNYYPHEKIGNSCHGTGDVYASAFTGAYIRGKSAVEAAKIAADYTLECIKETEKEENHWYGARFEPVLPYLIKVVNE